MIYKKQSYFKKISTLLPKVINKKIKKRNFIEMSLIEKWKEIIGEDISKFCYPVKVNFSGTDNKNGTIFLKTERGKSMEIEFKNEEILEKLNQFFGYKAIDKISIIQDFGVINQKKSTPIKKNIGKPIVVKKIKNNSLRNALEKLNKTLFKE